MKILLSGLMMLVPVFCVAQTAPGTEIYLLDISQKKNILTLNNPRNITQHVGYDNQPYFHPEKPLLYFSSAQAEGRTDLMEYSIRKKTTRPVTSTPEREFSPTVTPDKNFLSCIIQRDNGEQNLGKYPLAGGAPEIVIKDLIVGYHAWTSTHALIAFILGQPNSLHFIDLDSKKDTVLASQIGRSLHRIPGENAMSFTQKGENNDWLIKRLDLETLAITTITTCLPGKERDITWTPDGRILSSDEKNLFIYDPKQGGSWTTIAWPGSFSVTTVSRLAVDPTGRFLAVVMAE